MDALPEGFIATALSLTSPRDACMLALVSSRFRSAADSDVVWERFLPPDYEQIISRSTKNKSKKELYFYLCDHPILIDDGTKSFSIERWTGKKCIMLAARNLEFGYNEFGYNDRPLPCRWISQPESRFSQVAELFVVCRLNFRGKIKTSLLSPNTTYSAFLVFTPYIHGPQFPTVRSAIGIDGQESDTRNVCLDIEGFKNPRSLPGNMDPRRFRFRKIRNIRMPRVLYVSLHKNDEFPKKRDDEWTEVLLGEFHIKEGQDCDLEISLMNGMGNNEERGLIIEGIEIRPNKN